MTANSKCNLFLKLVQASQALECLDVESSYKLLCGTTSSAWLAVAGSKHIVTDTCVNLSVQSHALVIHAQTFFDFDSTSTTLGYEVFL